MLKADAFYTLCVPSMNMQRTLVVSFTKSLKAQINLISLPTSMFFPEASPSASLQRPKDASPLYAGVTSCVAKQSRTQKQLSKNVSNYYPPAGGKVVYREVCTEEIRLRRKYSGPPSFHYGG